MVVRGFVVTVRYSHAWLLLFALVFASVYNASAGQFSNNIDTLLDAARSMQRRCEHACGVLMREQNVTMVSFVAMLCYAVYKRYYSDGISMPDQQSNHSDALMMPDEEHAQPISAAKADYPAIEAPRREPVMAQDAPVVQAPNKVTVLIQACLEKNPLQVIEGNGIPGRRSWDVPSGKSIVAEGGRSELLCNSSVVQMTLEIVADENLLDYFSVTETPTEFRVIPREGCLLVSKTTVVKRLLCRNLSVPASLSRGVRVISVDDL